MCISVFCNGVEKRKAAVIPAGSWNKLTEGEIFATFWPN